MCGLDVRIGLLAVPGAEVLHVRQVHDVVVDAVDSAADDDLITVARLGHSAHDAGDLLHLGLVDGRGITKLEPQAGCAVGQADDVVAAAHHVHDLGRS